MSPPSEAKKAEVLRLGRQGLSNSKIEEMTGVGQSQIAGLLFRAKIVRKKKNEGAWNQPVNHPTTMALRGSKGKRAVPIPTVAIPGVGSQTNVVSLNTLQAQGRTVKKASAKESFTLPLPARAGIAPGTSSVVERLVNDHDFGGRRSPFPTPSEVSGNPNDLTRREIAAIAFKWYR